MFDPLNLPAWILVLSMSLPGINLNLVTSTHDNVAECIARVDELASVLSDWRFNDPTMLNFIALTCMPMDVEMFKKSPWYKRWLENEGTQGERKKL